MIGEILVKILTCLLMSPSFLACWRGMINLIYFILYIYIYICKHHSYKCRNYKYRMCKTYNIRMCKTYNIYNNTWCKIFI